MSEKPQDEQLSGKVVCATWPVTPHLLDGHPCSDPRPAQPQAPAPSLDARAALREIFLEAGFLTNDPQASRRAIRELAEAALAAPSAPSDALREAMGLLRLVRCCAGQDPLTNCTMFKAVNAWRRKNDPEWRAPDGSAAPTAPKEPQR